MRFIWHNGAWREVVRSAPRIRAFNIGRDHMDATVHPCTGQLMDSKSEFRRVTREHGMVELGNDWQQERRPVELSEREIKQTISDSWDQVEAGHVPPPIETPRELMNVETQVYQ